jgi:hypothetical protein
MDLWSIVFGALLMLEAVLILDGIGHWQQGHYKETAENGLLGGYLWVAFLLHHSYGLHTTAGFVLLSLMTILYWVILKALNSREEL